jgi:hypothetical protein
MEAYAAPGPRDGSGKEAGQRAELGFDLRWSTPRHLQGMGLTDLTYHFAAEFVGVDG